MQHYKAGNNPTEKYLPSKLEDPEKRPHNIPFSPSAQTAKYVGLTIKCVECEKPRLLHSKHKLKEQQVKTLKSFLSKIIYICGSNRSEYEGPEEREEQKIRETVYTRENLSCSSKVELPNFSVDHLKPVCVHCGCEGTGRTLNISEINYPKCSQCGSKDDVPKRKRKIVTAEDLANKRNK